MSNKYAELRGGGNGHSLLPLPISSLNQNGTRGLAAAGPVSRDVL